MRRFVCIMLGVSLLIAGVVSWYASSHPDGLERVAENLGFITRAREPSLSLLRDFCVRGLKGFLSNGLAGTIGVLATFGLVLLLGRVFLRGKKH